MSALDMSDDSKLYQLLENWDTEVKFVCWFVFGLALFFFQLKK